MIKHLFAYSFIFLLGLGLGYFLNYTPQQNKNAPLQPAIEEPIQTTVKTVQKELKIIKKEPSFNKTDNLSTFKQLLQQQKYPQALQWYNQQHNNDTKEKYQNILYAYVQANASKTQSIKALLTLYLEYEYSDTIAKLALSRIYLNEQEYETAFEFLEELQESYLNDEIKEEVSKTFNESIQAYIKTLPKYSQEKLNFLKNLYEKYQKESYMYWLSLEYFHLKNYEEAKELFDQFSESSVYYHDIQSYLNIVKKKLKQQMRYTHKIKLQKKNNHFFIKASVNDTPITLLIDTGATYTLIKSHIIGDNLKNKKIIQLNTANGVKKAYLGEIDSFKIQELELHNLQITSSNLEDNSIDGLLGMSFLKHFDFYIDQEEAVLYLE